MENGENRKVVSWCVLTLLPTVIRSSNISATLKLRMYKAQVKARNSDTHKGLSVISEYL